GEHEDWSLEAAPAQRIQHLESALLRQPHVENDQIVGFGYRPRFASFSVRDKVRGPALFLDAALDVLPDGRVVLDDQDAQVIPGRSRDARSRIRGFCDTGSSRRCPTAPRRDPDAIE